MSNITVGNEEYRVIQDKKFVSDFDELLIEAERIEKH